MSLTVDFTGTQSCDCSQYSINDLTNYGDNDISLFSGRSFIITNADGTQTTIDFPFNLGNVLVIPQSKDFASVGTLKLVPISPVDGYVYYRDRNIISTCRSDQMARAKQKEYFDICDKKKVLFEIMDINSGIISAKRLNRIGLIDEAQCVLSYLDKTYGEFCDCGCINYTTTTTSTTTTTTAAP